MQGLPQGVPRGFPHICPDFVIALRSESDSLEDLKNKMNDWIANGADLEWLVDPFEHQVLVYRPGHVPEVITGNEIAGGGPVECFVLDLGRVWKGYRDRQTPVSVAPSARSLRFQFPR